MSNNFGLVSEWYYESSLDGLIKLLKLGDLLEFDRVMFKHWAVCVKVNGKSTMVAHRSSNEGMLQLSLGSHSVSKQKHGVGSISEQALVDVLGKAPGHSVRINNSLDQSRKPLLQATIIEMVYECMADESKVGTYNVLSNNCEHFAKHCRYGCKSSQQVTQLFGPLFE